MLTLSATPIPRTLNMSLSGLRDMSLIERRRAIGSPFNAGRSIFRECIKSAIELETGPRRAGVSDPHRVETIETIAGAGEAPGAQARLAVGHGQMNEKEMERVMLDFIEHKYDVLVATTIIENGIDIPRANTIIINRADQYVFLSFTVARACGAFESPRLRLSPDSW